MTNLNGQPKKIAIMGSGAIGMELALNNLHNQYPNTEIVIWNRDSGTGTGAAISGDQAESIRQKFRRNPTSQNQDIKYTTDMEAAMRGADIVVVTGGIPRKDAKQQRTELAAANLEFIDPIAEKAGQIARANRDHKTTYVIGTNPIGLIDQRFQEVSKIPHEQIIGLSGELDVERLRQSIRINLHVSNEDIRGERVIGDHGPNMVPVLSQIEIFKETSDGKEHNNGRQGNWLKLLDLPEVHLNEERILKELKDATAKGGAKLVGWAGKSDYRAPAAALAYMIEQIVDARWGDKTAALPITASTYVPEAGVYSGQTIKFNDNGTYSMAPTPPLSGVEAAALEKSITQAKTDLQHFEKLASQAASVRIA